MRLRTLQVVPSYYPATVYGGPIFSIHYTCAALARLGVDIRVASTNANGTGKLDVTTDEPVAFADNYRVRYYDETIIGRFSWAFTRHVGCDIGQADLIHLQDVFSTHAAWTLMLAARFGKPVLISARGVLAPWALEAKRSWAKRVWLAALVRPFVRDARRVGWHATSAAERADILARFPGAPVHVVPNGLDCAQYDQAPRPRRAAYLARFFAQADVEADKAQVLVALGRLHRTKSFDVAIRAFHAIAEAHPEAVLLIAGGDDGERGALERLIAKLNLAERVSLIGEVTGDDKIAFLKGADLSLFPSQSENFGMVALEALAAGLPVIASRNTPWEEIEQEGAGLWVENTAQDFAAAIEALLAGNLAPRRETARALASRYDITAIARRFKEIYEEMVGGKQP